MTIVAPCPNCGGEMKLESPTEDVSILRAIARISQCDRCQRISNRNRSFRSQSHVKTNGKITWSEFSQPKEQ